MPNETESGSTQPLERKLATILSSDVAEFSRLMGEDEEQTLKTFRGHKRVFESLVAMHRGRIFNTAGDAILAEFASAVEAVRAATDIQAALRTRNDQLPPSRQVKFRIGINLGDVMVHGEDLLGDGVNVAARLQTAAQPGGICISGSVFDQIRNKLSLSFQSLGEMHFKNIQQSVRTFSIVEAASSVGFPAIQPQPAKSSPAKWIIAGLLLLVVVAAGAYWAYTSRQGSNTEQAKERAATPPQEATPHEVAQPSAQAPGTMQPPPPESAAQPSAGKAAPAAHVAATRPPTASEVKPAEEAPRETTARRPAQQNAGAARPIGAAGAGPYDGVYSGQICYGQTPKLPAHCYHAEGTISGARITGQWPVGKEKGVTMFLEGDVTRSGDVKIQMHSQKEDGSPGATINLTGTVHAGLITAQGSFLVGRSATLNWRKNAGGSP